MNAFLQHPQFLFAMPGGTELLLILLVILLFFGGKKIPDLMRGIGKGVKEFNDAKGSNKKDSKESSSEKEEVVTKTSESSK